MALLPKIFTMSMFPNFNPSVNPVSSAFFGQQVPINPAEVFAALVKQAEQSMAIQRQLLSQQDPRAVEAVYPGYHFSAGIQKLGYAGPQQAQGGQAPQDQGQAGADIMSLLGMGGGQDMGGVSPMGQGMGNVPSMGQDMGGQPMGGTQGELPPPSPEEMAAINPQSAGSGTAGFLGGDEEGSSPTEQIASLQAAIAVIRQGLRQLEKAVEAVSTALSGTPVKTAGQRYNARKTAAEELVDYFRQG